MVKVQSMLRLEHNIEGDRILALEDRKDVASGTSSRLFQISVL